MATCPCGRPVSVDSESLDYCSERCQTRWMEQRCVPLPVGDVHAHTVVRLIREDLAREGHSPTGRWL